MSGHVLSIENARPMETSYRRRAEDWEAHGARIQAAGRAWGYCSCGWSVGPHGNTTDGHAAIRDAHAGHVNHMAGRLTGRKPS